MSLTTPAARRDLSFHLHPSTNLRQVQTDGAVGNQWLIRGGLAPGDRLIVEGLQSVKPGDAVHAVPTQLILTR